MTQTLDELIQIPRDGAFVLWNPSKNGAFPAWYDVCCKALRENLPDAEARFKEMLRRVE